jgi:acyl-CoA synthetase (NDP forming)
LKHRLDPLLRPQSVALIGASARTDSLGEWSLRNLLKGRYAGRIYLVNPRYDELQGIRCFGNIADLPEVPDLAVFCVADRRVEAALDEVIAAGVPAAALMSALVLDDDDDPNLSARVRDKINNAGMRVCGANGMGFYNIRDHVWICGFDSGMHEAPGSVSLISHSGAGMSGIIDCDKRIRCNVAISTGNELDVTMDEYLDFVLDLPETRVVGLFIETARNPDGFRAALQKAVEKKIPVVALKVGRTDEAARLAVSHSGAMAGDDATYDALFDRYGVQRVCDMDEFATALILFAELHPVGEGGLVALHDSGGERQLLVDLAHDAGVPLTRLASNTVAALENVLDAELPAVNPLDAWSRGGPGAAERMAKCFSLLLQDPGAAIGAVIHDRAPDGKIYASYINYMKCGHRESGKPVALVASRQGTGCDDNVVKSTHAGFPVLDGVSTFLAAVRSLFACRDFLMREPQVITSCSSTVTDAWRSKLSRRGTMSEAESFAMLADFGLSTIPHETASNLKTSVEAGARLGYPLALKTATPGISHKSEKRGVVLALDNEAELAREYEAMSERLGPDVLLAAMAPRGVEMILGVRRDPQFGPVIIIGMGGVLAEVVKDVTFALPPFDDSHARRCVDRLRLRPALDGLRGSARRDIEAFCSFAARFSAMVHALQNEIREVDINPVIVGEHGCVAVDALVVSCGSAPD